MSKEVSVLTYFLEMREVPAEFVSPPDRNLHIIELETPAIDYYRYLYNRVGANYNWVERNMIENKELGALLSSSEVEVHVLYDSGAPAGFVELDFSKPGECELVYFGLLEDFQGLGLGKYFLGWAIRRAWTKEINRLWLHTCEWDHPSALPVYQKAGFRLFEEKQVAQALPD